MQKLKKTILKQGDFVSLQSLSGGIAGEKNFYQRFLIGKQRIEEIKLKPLVSKNALKGVTFIKDHPEKRAADLMEAILDQEVKCIIANIGGFDSHTIIKYLDANKIKANPKPILGYSDITSLHLFFYSIGIQTFYGPMVLDGFAENTEMHKITHLSAKKALFSDEPEEFTSSEYWTSQMLDWNNPANNLIKRTMKKEEHGLIFVNGIDKVEGHLIGGCLDTIIKIKGESFWPSINHWQNSIIFLETSESKMSPEEFENAIILLKEEINVCNGLIFGKPKDEQYYDEYFQILKKLVSKPFVFNLNFGHTAPMYTIKYGEICQLDFSQKIVKTLK